MSDGLTPGGLAESALEGAASAAGSEVFSSLFGSGGRASVDLSDAAYAHIAELITDALKKQKLQDEKDETEAIRRDLRLCADNNSTPGLNIQEKAQSNVTGLLSIGYKATEAYWAGAAQLLLILRLIHDSDPTKGATAIADTAVSTLGDLLTLEGEMRNSLDLETFSTFKRYTLGEDPYSNVADSPLAYMGKNYRENVQKVLGLIDKFDPNRRSTDPTKPPQLSQIQHPKYVINFLSYEDQLREGKEGKVMWLWDTEGNQHHGIQLNCRFWMCWPIDDYYPLGDICRPYPPRGNSAPDRIPYIKAIGKGRLAFAQDYVRKWKDHGTLNPNDISFWNPVPPDGFSMMATIINRSQDEKPTDQRCVVVPSEDVAMTAPGAHLWDSVGTHAQEDGSAWRHPEKSFGEAGLFIGGRTLTSSPSETPVGVFKQAAIGGHPYLGVRPGRPNFDPSNWTQTAGAYGTSGRWNKGYKVRYRVGFYGDYGTFLGPWWAPTHWPGADENGFYGGDKWACPTVTNISIDPAGIAAGRILYREFMGRDPEVVAVIANNTDTRFLDTADDPPYGPPVTAPSFDPGNWTGEARNNIGHWVPGYKVRYAVSFYDAAGETPKGPWWSPTYGGGADENGFYGAIWAFPTLIDIPVDKTNTAIGRRIYRQFYDVNFGGFGNPTAIEQVGQISNNTETRFHDTQP